MILKNRNLLNFVVLLIVAFFHIEFVLAKDENDSMRVHSIINGLDIIIPAGSKIRQDLIFDPTFRLRILIHSNEFSKNKSPNEELSRGVSLNFIYLEPEMRDARLQELNKGKYNFYKSDVAGFEGCYYFKINDLVSIILPSEKYIVDIAGNMESAQTIFNVNKLCVRS